MSIARAVRVADKCRCGQPHRMRRVLLDGKPPVTPPHEFLASEGRCGACRGCLAFLRGLKRANGAGATPLFLRVVVETVQKVAPIRYAEPMVKYA